jgi:TRAP-type C4-dicarboxylate transport system permease small subunit
LSALLAVLAGVNRVLLGVCRIATVAFVAVITVVVSAGVFWRYVLNDALSWSEEVAKFAMVWLAFVGAPLALAQGGHVAIEALQRLLPGRARHLLAGLVMGIVTAVLVVFVWRGTTFAWNGRIQVSPVVAELSMAWVFAAIPAGSLVMLLVAVELALRHLLHAAAPASFAAPALDAPAGAAE